MTADKYGLESTTPQATATTGHVPVADGSGGLVLQAPASIFSPPQFAVDTTSLTTNLQNYWALTSGLGGQDLVGSLHLSHNNVGLRFPQDPQIGGSATSDFIPGSVSHYFHADDASFPSGATDWAISCWVYADAVGINYMTMTKQSGASDLSFILYRTTTNVMQFGVTHNGTTFAFVETGTMSAGVWNHVYAYHDGTTDELGISLNNTAATPVSHTLGVYDSGAELWIGDRQGGGSLPFDGMIRDCALWTGAVLTGAQITELYNSGNGNFYR